MQGGMATHSSILAWRIPRDRGAWWATVHGFTELDMTEQLTLSLSGKLIMNVKSTKDFCRNLW